MSSKISKEEFEKIVKESKNIKECLYKMGVKSHFGNYKTFHRYRIMYNVDTSHFVNYATEENLKKRRENSKKAEEYFVKSTVSVKSQKLLKLLLENNLKEYKCEKCGISEWNGMPIKLQVHHVDGNHMNNEINNLEILCPNCHSQTDNFCGRKFAIFKGMVCKKCGNKVSKYSRTGLCRKCTAENQRKVERPTKEELISLISTMPYVKIAKQFGVSDKTIVKWCKFYDIDYKTIHKTQ